MRFFQKFLFSGLALLILAIRTRKPNILPSDAVGFGLLILVALPWLDLIIKSAELPGGWKFEFREQVKALKDQVAVQQELINTLVKYSVSASIFTHLCGITLLKYYGYEDNDTNRRELYFLRDNGFIMLTKGNGFVDFNRDIHGRNLAVNSRELWTT
jgi:hypothetical protein